MNQQEWFVFYTKSRQEKKVKEFLERAGFEIFLPIHKVMRQWSDRKKKVELPLFPSYIFVRVTEDKIVDVLQTPGVAWNVKLDKKPAVLHPHELKIINRFLESGFTIETSVAISDFKKGDAIEILDGVFKGLQGRLLIANEGQRFVVAIESIGQNLSVTIDPVLIRKL